jgi:hypothetical protein
MNHLKTFISAAGLLAAAASQAGGAILVTEPSGDGFGINTGIVNGSSFDISKLTFDFTTSHTADGGHIVIGGSPSVTAPAGGTATFFGGGAVLGFTYTGFSTFGTSKFSWDPDSNFDSSHGATGLDFVGGKVTAITSGGGVYTGTFARVGTSLDVTASLAPVPEPATYALMVGGLLAVGALTRRRATSQV